MSHALRMCCLILSCTEAASGKLMDTHIILLLRLVSSLQSNQHSWDHVRLPHVRLPHVRLPHVSVTCANVTWQVSHQYCHWFKSCKLCLVFNWYSTSCCCDYTMTCSFKWSYATPILGLVCCSCYCTERSYVRDKVDRLSACRHVHCEVREATFRVLESYTTSAILIFTCASFVYVSRWGHFCFAGCFV